MSESRGKEQWWKIRWPLSLESVSNQTLVWLNCVVGGMVGFKVCSGALAVTFGLVPLFIIIYLFIHFPSCRTFPRFEQTGRFWRHCGTHGLRGASLWGERGWCRVWSVLHGSPGFAYSDVSMYILKSTFRRCFLALTWMCKRLHLFFTKFGINLLWQCWVP